MDAIFKWNGRLNLTVPNALRSVHDDARAGLVRATMEGGRIAKAAKRVAQLCLPHFEHEEKGVFPVLALLPHLSPRNLRPEMMDAMALISDFREKRDAMIGDHQSIESAIEEMLQAAHREKNREFADLAHHLRAHEKIEEEVIYPTVVLIGDYLRKNLAD